ncbi:MAG: ABC transporter substrate-binding protein, partial [Betaproteobacteria bacterium]|nr:ABC transporter substrate-binding protein [Betaproteobacteria bacterium]
QVPHGPRIEVFPPSHGAVIFIDTMAIPASARNVDNAYRFINYRLQPKVCAADSNAVYYANPVPASRPYLDARVGGNDFVFLEPDMMARLIPPKVYTPEERRMVTRLYTRLRTGL